MVAQKIFINPKQTGNPLIDFFKGNIAWEYNPSLVPDYQVGAKSCLLFLSLKYHRLHPEYIGVRIRDLHATAFTLRVLLVHVDVENNQQIIRELSQLCFKFQMTIILAWSVQDCAKYIETLKSYENKGADSIKEKADLNQFSQLSRTLTGIKSVNKTDVVTLTSNFSCLKDIINAPAEKLQALPGFADQKVKRFRDAFDQPFFQKI